MIIKNGQIYHKLSIQKNTNKQTKMIIKNGQIYHNQTFQKKVLAAITGYGQKVLSIASTSVNRLIGVTIATIDNVIGAK